MNDRIPPEADWEQAPNILDGATTVEMNPYDCDLEYWLTAVAQGSLKGLVRGRKPESGVPDFLREPGPLRDALISEFAFRSLSEDAATKACAMLVGAADDIEGREFYATQTLDEARHAQTFRLHLVDLGVPEERVLETLEEVAGEDRDRVLEPLWEWGLPVWGEKFINGVVIVTVLLEGVLAPTTELSERKWKPLSPATADIERGACVDEIRHLAVGSWFVRRHLERHPEEKQEIVDLIVEGRRQWESLPVPDLLMRRETLYQEGIEQHREAIGDYELLPGRPLIDTTPEERLMLAVTWSMEVQESRLTWMGLEEAIPGRAPAA